MEPAVLRRYYSVFIISEHAFIWVRASPITMKD